MLFSKKEIILSFHIFVALKLYSVTEVKEIWQIQGDNGWDLPISYDIVEIHHKFPHFTVIIYDTNWEILQNL